MKVGVVDYDAGNLTSVSTALKALNTEFTVSGDPKTLEGCDRLIFPGVGEANYAMKILTERGLDLFLPKYAASGRPLLGICLGCQIILSYSTENDTDCLGILQGEAALFPGDMGVKVPHMGWNSLIYQKEHPLFNDIPPGTSFYFVHSYYPQVNERLSIAQCSYGLNFSAAIGKDNIAAVQFHPEKSGPFGLRLLSNFLSWQL
jgi:imidazole glycerol-phosphate synthase subunit HisH